MASGGIPIVIIIIIIITTTTISTISYVYCAIIVRS